MDLEARRRRREDARRRTRRRRVAAAVAAGAVGVAGAALAAAMLGDAEEKPARPAAELPRGGRQIFPRYRVVAFYGSPQDERLGALGTGSPEKAARRLAKQARAYRRDRRAVMPAFELIATVASSEPGEDGDYSNRVGERTIRRYLAAIRQRKGLLILDIQPGRASFMREARAYRRLLEEPDVSLALDPEWSMDAGQVPGQQIGSTDAAIVNEISRYLERLVQRGNLPQKLLVVHRFTKDMIGDEELLERHPGVSLTVNVDGFGDRPNKISKYRALTRRTRGHHHGFKLFYEEDTNLMSPRDVLSLRPKPDLVVYE